MTYEPEFERQNKEGYQQLVMAVDDDREASQVLLPNENLDNIYYGNRQYSVASYSSQDSRNDTEFDESKRARVFTLKVWAPVKSDKFISVRIAELRLHLLVLGCSSERCCASQICTSVSRQVMNDSRLDENSQYFILL